MEVRVTQSDKMPGVCVVCGSQAVHFVDVPFVERRRMTYQNYRMWGGIGVVCMGQALGPNEFGVWLIIGLFFFPLVIAATVIVIRRLMGQLLPSIERRLPVCNQHDMEIAAAGRRVWLLPIGLVGLYVGVGFFLNTSHSWPLFASATIFVLFLYLTEDFVLGAVDVNPRMVTLTLACPEFVEEFQRMNGELPFDLGMALENGQSREEDVA